MLHRFRRKIRQAVFITIALALIAFNAHSSDDPARISANIQQFHMPYGTVLDPVFASSDPNSSDYSRIVGYARAGDSAIWTGHYLAAEAFRYRVTRSADALENAWRALRGIRSLLDITGNDALARCLLPANSEFANGIVKTERGHGIYDAKLGGEDYLWIGGTSRDQYSGVMFGLSVAFEFVDDPGMRDFIRADVARILNYLLRHNWSVVMPDRTVSTSFRLRPDQQLSFLQVGRKIDPEKFEPIYSSYRSSYAAAVILPIAYDNLDDHNHYFKFNLNYINLFSLARLEEDDSPFKETYLDAYAALRRRTDSHGNAHFNLIDLALRGPEPARDSETVTMLEVWGERRSRDNWTDLRARKASCRSDDRACDPIPVNQRVNTDFLWQRSPFLLYGGGFGTIETAAIDYILSYWMARTFGLLY
jgi:hypothetical protein